MQGFHNMKSVRDDNENVNELFRMDYRSWAYVISDDGILSFNVLTSRAATLITAGFIVFATLFIGLPQVVPSNPSQVPLAVVVGVLLFFIVVLSYPLIVRLVTSTEKRKLRRLSAHDLINSSSTSLPLLSLANKRKLVKIGWDEITNIELRQNKMRIRFGNGWKRKLAEPKFDRSQFLALQSLLAEKIGARLVVKN